MTWHEDMLAAAVVLALALATLRAAFAPKTIEAVNTLGGAIARALARGAGAALALAVCAAAVSGALAATDIAPWSAQREVLARTHEAVAAELL